VLWHENITKSGKESVEGEIDSKEERERESQEGRERAKQEE